MYSRGEISLELIESTILEPIEEKYLLNVSAIVLVSHDEDVKLLGQKIEVSQIIGAAHAPLATQFPQRPLHQQEPEPDYTWKIANFTRKLAQAKSDNEYGRIESEPFFTSYGYKMKLLVNFNEAPSGYAGYMGVYLILMKSDRDGTLPWPFTKRYKFGLVDQQDDLEQRQNIEAAFTPTGHEENFKRPRQRENKLGMGNPQFVKHSTLRTRQYIRDDAVYIKIQVDS
ncbi:TNF receptor-associated factor 4-like [Paramuricea clavata]|uniref:TNF receptor-associated factor 4-like n=1 Tax=Paramuricea clavata TaxID=317549 RepID=A0A7D9IH66_PARCT|nr:TNF receptor-associated factor 4-like [Paramuricea clavata]